MNKAFELLSITLFTVLGLMPSPRSEGAGGVGTGGGLFRPVDIDAP